MEEGIVPGGGIALWNVFQQESGRDAGSAVAKAAKTILMKALEAPLTAIVTNSGQSPTSVMNEISKKKKESKDKNESVWMGYNADKNEVSDLRKFGIIDPLKVTKTAFVNALSVASNYLVTGAAVTELPKKESPAPPAGGMPGMGEY